MFQVGATAGRGGEGEKGREGTRGGLQPPNRSPPLSPALPCLPVRLAANTQQLGEYLRGGGRVESPQISGRSFRGPPSSWRRRSTFPLVVVVLILPLPPLLPVAASADGPNPLPNCCVFGLRRNGDHLRRSPAVRRGWERASLIRRLRADEEASDCGKGIRGRACS